MKLEQSFEVEAPIEQVWEALIDLERVAPCLPGAAITGEADGAYHGEFTLKVGPFATVHRGTIRIDAADDAVRGGRDLGRRRAGGAAGRDAAAGPRPRLHRRMSDCDAGICGGDVPPLIGQVLTGTGLTLPQAAARLERGEPLTGLTEVQRRIVEDFALDRHA